jgi:G3E family GTPase
MADVNIDAALVRNINPEEVDEDTNIQLDENGNYPITITRREEKMVELTNGCICCTLREDLLQEVSKLALENRFDYLIIESSGISEPLPVAETFTFEGEAGNLSLLAKLDTLVTVVDGSTFMNELNSIESLKSRNWQAAEEDVRTIAHLLIDQVEFANVIILNKVDIISLDDKQLLTSILKKLNPSADIIESIYSQIDINRILNTNRFTLQEAEKSPEWLKEARIGKKIN